MHSNTHIHVHTQVKATQVIAAPQATGSSPMAAIRLSVNEILEVRGVMCSMEGVDQGLGCSVQAHGGGHLS